MTAANQGADKNLQTDYLRRCPEEEDGTHSSTPACRILESGGLTVHAVAKSRTRPRD